MLCSHRHLSPLVQNVFIKDKDFQKRKAFSADVIKEILEVILSSANKTTGNDAAAFTYQKRVVKVHM